MDDARRPPQAVRLLDSVRAALRMRHYSPRTEKAYAGWVRRYVLFHGKRHPREMGEAEVDAFLAALASEGRLGASAQNQALAALLFLYRVVLGRALDLQVHELHARRRIRTTAAARRAHVGGPHEAGRLGTRNPLESRDRRSNRQDARGGMYPPHIPHLQRLRE